MRNFLFGFLLLLACNLFAQKTFTFLDSTFSYGQLFRTYRLTFELNKATFKAESYPHLDSLAEFLSRNKNLTIEVQNHCDSRYSDKMSMCWTCARAQAIVDYLVSKGITKERLISKGFNDNKLLIPDSQIKKAKTKNEKEALHALNRRTEYKILSTDFKQ